MHDARLVLAAAAACTSAAFAGPVDLDEIPRDAALVVHVDVERCFESDLVATMLEELDGVDLDDLADVGAVLGIDVDLEDDLLGVTLVAFSAEDDEAVIMLHTSDVLAEVIESFEGQGVLERLGRNGDWSVAELEDGGVMAYRENRDGTHRVILAENGELIEQAAEARKGFRAAEPARGTLVYAASNDLRRLISDDDLPPGLATARSMVFSLTEDDDELSMDLRVTADAEEDAATLAQALNGVLAWVRLAGMEEELGDLISEIDIAHEGRTVALTLGVETDTLLEAVRGQIDLGDEWDEEHRHEDEDEHHWHEDDDDRDDDEIDERIEALEEALEELEETLEELEENDAPRAAIRAIERAMEDIEAEIEELEDGRLSRADDATDGPDREDAGATDTGTAIAI
ncbi:MAG: hypothetical protein AAFX79_12815 [Planctomycetota bacterium]